VAVSHPWERTIHLFLDGVKQNPDWFDDLVVDGRYAWKLLLRLPENARVLDLGCGLGNLVKNIAPHVGRVEAFDLTIERLEFARARFRRFNAADHIALTAGGDGTYLPFPANSFDCVTLSGVLEWVAADNAWRRGDTRARRAARAFLSFFGNSNPRAMQLRFLAEIRRILKPDGQLFIAIENRLSYCYFGGRRDHHSGLWFGSLLPRFVANLYSMAARRSPYRTYTYSISGLRRLLRAAGFPVAEFYGLTPGYTQLAELIPLATKAGLWRPPVPRGRGRIKRNQHFVPAYGLIASQEVLQRTSLAEQLASSLEVQLHLTPGTLRFTRFRVTSKNKGIISAETSDRSIVVKVPFNAAIAARAARNYRFLEQAKEREHLRHLVPRPACTGEIRGIQYYAEERSAGEPLGRVFGSSASATWFDAACGFLESLNPTLDEREPGALSEETYRREVLEPLEKVAQAVGTSLVDRLASFFHERLRDLKVRPGIVHGDFSVSNIFVHECSIVGVVDWDDSSPIGIPALDAINLVDSAQRMANRHASSVDAVLRLSDLAALDDEEGKFLRLSYDRCGIDLERHFALVLLYWLRHVADQLDGGLVYDRPAIEERITTVFEKVLALQ
jgi:ubiquinone/menaquinone biosynthesis C-methylase UbiE/aminoglycoside phosphotransferase (APT) family kinase protein